MSPVRAVEGEKSKPPIIIGGNGGDGMEARIAKLEANVEHIQSDVTDIKTDIRSLRDKIDEVKEAISSTKIWALLLYIGLAAALFGTMAKGFHWI